MPRFTPPSSDVNSILVTLREIIRYIETQLSENLSKNGSQIRALEQRVNALEERVKSLENSNV